MDAPTLGWAAGCVLACEVTFRLSRRNRRLQILLAPAAVLVVTILFAVAGTEFVPAWMIFAPLGIICVSESHKRRAASATPGHPTS